MPGLSDAELFEFAHHFESLSEAIALSLSETINRLVAFDPPDISQPSINTLIADPQPLLQTTFTYPALSADEGSILFSEADAVVLADLAAMGDGSSPPPELDDEHVNVLSVAMGALAQGMGLAIGNAISESVFPGPAGTTKLVPLTLSTAF